MPKSVKKNLKTLFTKNIKTGKLGEVEPYR